MVPLQPTLFVTDVQGIAFRHFSGKLDLRGVVERQTAQENYFYI